MRFPDYEPQLMTQDDGSRLPWGFGAIAVVPAPPGIHGCCGAKVRKNDGLHVFQDTDTACTKCSREWCEANFVEPPVEVPMGQQSLGEVA